MILDKNLNTLENLNLKKDILQELFTKKTIKIGDELITKELTYSETEITIKSYMEDLYSQLFDTIMHLPKTYLFSMIPNVLLPLSFLLH